MAWRWVYQARLRLRSLFRRADVERELEEEMRFHVEAQTRHELAAGGSAEGARRATRGIEQRKEECRDMRGLNWLDDLRRDLRYGARTLGRSPGFTLTAMAALALGVGANTAMYSIVRAVMLRPLDLREPDRLVRVYESNPSRNAAAFAASVGNYLSWKQQARSLELAVFQGYPANWTRDGEPARLDGVAASASFLPVLGMSMRMGRWFHDDEERAGKHRVAVLSEAMWEARFGRDPGAVGRTLILNEEPYTVIGIASEGLKIPSAPDLWVPLVADPKASRGNRQFTVIGRLAPGATVRQAQAELASIAANLERQFPESNRGWSVSLVPMMRWLVATEIRTALLVLLAAAGVVLLIACGNVANLLVARGEARRKEFAIRAAIGAGMPRIARQLLTENLLLSFLGGTLGVALGYAIVGVARRSLQEIVPRAGEISIDGATLAFALALSLITGLLFGSTPIVLPGGMRNPGALRAADRSSHMAARSRLRAALTIAQLSLATLLLIGAGLLLRSFARLLDVSLGFDPEGVLTARISPPRARYADGETISTLLSRLTGELRSAPWVEAAGVSNGIPLGAGSTISGEAVADSGQSTSVGWRSADAGYFAALRIPVLRGRLFGPEDGSSGRRVFVLSREAARSLYGDADPAGRQLTLNGVAGEVIGVAADVRMKSAADSPERLVYVPIAQGGRFGAFAVFVRTGRGSPEAAASLIRERLREIDAALPAYGFRAMTDWLDNSSARARIRTRVLALLAAVALTLGTIGIYGVLSYLVALRRHEFGVRLAMGAPPGSLVRLVLGQGLGLASIGIAIGLAGATVLARVLDTLLFEVAPNDPLTFGGVAALLFLTVLVACYAPARRAARVDPIAALRSE